MATVRRGSLVGSVFDAVFRPAEFVAVREESEFGNRSTLARRLVALAGFYLWNVFLYATPLTLAGIGFTTTAAAPAWFAGLTAGVVQTPDTLWRLFVGLVQNSAFLTIATGVVLVSYHGAVALVTGPGGVLKSFHTVVYTTGAYLAALFTGVMYLSTAPGLGTAESLVLNLQKRGFYLVIDWLGADVGLPGGRPDAVVIGTLSPTGQAILALLGVAAIYFLYSLYLGARINHGISRSRAAAVLAAVAAAPVIYIAGTVLYSTVIL